MPITRTPAWVCLNTGNVVWTNQPAAATELFGLTHRRVLMNLTDVDKARLVARVSTIGSASAVLFTEYSLDESAWQTLTPSVAIGGGAASTRASAWGVVPLAARGEVFIRVVGSGADGVADPVLGNIQLEVL